MSQQGQGSSGGGMGAGIFLLGVGAVFGAGSLLVWVAGSIAGLLAGGGPVLISLSEACAVFARLPAHVGDPSSAWPATVRDQLPGPSTMRAAVLVAIGVLTAAAALALWIRRRVRRDRHREHQGARSATGRDLRRLHVAGPQRGRVILGRHRRRLVASEPRTSVLVVAPTQSGKTTGLVVPAILEWDGPVLATSIKADVAQDTLLARSRVGEVKVFDPAGSTGLPNHVWSPIAASRTWEGARRTAAGLLMIREQDALGASGEDRFWKPAAARYLAPLLLAAAHGDRSVGEVLRWIARGEEDEVCAALETCPDPAAEVALDSLISVWAADERFRSSVLQTLATALDAWLEPTVARAAATGDGIEPSWLLDGRNTLYLTAPGHDQHRLRGLFTALIETVIAEAFDRVARTGRPINPPLLLCLDEAANVAPLPNLGEVASTAPGQGVQLLTVLQNKSQADDRWGRDRAETIIANHAARLFGAGIGDRTTLDYLAAVLGDEEIRKVAIHRQGLGVEPGSSTYSTDFRRLAPPDRVRQARTNSTLLIYANLPPAWIDLRPWYRDKRLRLQVKGARPHAPQAIEQNHDLSDSNADSRAMTEPPATRRTGKAVAEPDLHALRLPRTADDGSEAVDAS